MHTVKTIMLTHRKALIAVASLLVLTTVGGGAWLVLRQPKTSPPVTARKAPPATPDRPLPAAEMRPPPAAPPPPLAAQTDAASPANNTQAKPILVESEGKETPLDVKAIMALQRKQAERRLYDRVAALSGAATLPAGANVMGLAPPVNPGNLSTQRREDTGLGTLLGSSGPGSTGLPAGTPAMLPSSGAVAAPVVPPSSRLLSVYSRGDLLMAEVMLPNGRRVDLEVNDDFMGRRVSRIEESGMTLAGSGGRGTVHVAIGRSFTP